VAFPDTESLQKIGAFQAETVNAFAGFKHSASRHFMPWNLSNGIAVSAHLWAEAGGDASQWKDYGQHVRCNDGIE